MAGAGREGGVGASPRSLRWPVSQARGRRSLHPALGDGTGGGLDQPSQQRSPHPQTQPAGRGCAVDMERAACPRGGDSSVAVAARDLPAVHRGLPAGHHLTRLAGWGGGWPEVAPAARVWPAGPVREVRRPFPRGPGPFGALWPRGACRGLSPPGCPLLPCSRGSPPPGDLAVLLGPRSGVTGGTELEPLASRAPPVISGPH